MSGGWSPIATYLPELAVGAGVLCILLWGMVFPRRAPASLSLVALASLVGALYALIFNPAGAPDGSMMAAGGLPVFFRIAVIFAASMTIFLSHDYLAFLGYPAGDYYLLILLATLGMMITAGSGHLLVLFLGIELMSLSFTILAGFTPGSSRSKEASLKYLMYGLTASALLLFGLSVLYGLYASWDLAVIAGRIHTGGSPAAALALVLVIAGLGFKIGLVPFHMWVPDVYDGAPAPVAAYLSTGPKAAALCAAATLLPGTFGVAQTAWYPVLWGMAVASMTWGNMAALAQKSLKRMLAYSSVAQVGYLAIGLLAAAKMPEEGLSAMAFYLFTYLFFNIGIFALVIWAERPDGSGPTLDDIAGLGRRHPLLAAIFTLFLLSLAGIPPTSGFMGKFSLFTAAVRAGMVGLAVIGVINSALAAWYYLRVVWYFFMRDPDREISLEPGVGWYALLLAVIATLWFGLWPDSLLELARQASR